MVRNIQEKMTVGPKGQVVIPKIFRDLENIFPGNEIIFELKDEGILIRKIQYDHIKMAEMIAKSGKKLKKYQANKEYEKMLGERWKKAST
mgnify:CR=1 FL=1